VRYAKSPIFGVVGFLLPLDLAYKWKKEKGMKVHSAWSAFERQSQSVALDNHRSFLVDAALKRQREIEQEEDVDLDRDFPLKLAEQAMRRKASMQDRLRYIRRYNLVEETS
jgi:hypothetical protein